MANFGSSHGMTAHLPLVKQKEKLSCSVREHMQIEGSDKQDSWPYRMFYHSEGALDWRPSESPPNWSSVWSSFRSLSSNVRANGFWRNS